MKKLLMVLLFYVLVLFFGYLSLDFKLNLIVHYTLHYIIIYILCSRTITASNAIDYSPFSHCFGKYDEYVFQ